MPTYIGNTYLTINLESQIAYIIIRINFTDEKTVFMQRLNRHIENDLSNTALRKISERMIHVKHR